jgi:hypothetical protein
MTLRTTERDLTDAAAELRAEADDYREEREALVAEVREEYGSAEDAPPEKHDEYDQLTQQIAECEGTAETFEHYADEWAGPEADGAVFVLEELNGDEYAKVVDTVAGAAQARGGDLPGGAAAVEALNYGVVETPPGAPPDAGKWPAPIVNDLFEQLNDLTTPGTGGTGNSSLSAAVSQTTATDGGDSPPEGS